ncbi:early growth response protein 1 [Procambarus clarkii]|uniref:early growth response protein 1 n=1 Tax=Procambarus clarkii TaxID=6728 RepID=UPI0037449807
MTLLECTAPYDGTAAFSVNPKARLFGKSSKAFHFRKDSEICNLGEDCWMPPGLFRCRSQSGVSLPRQPGTQAKHNGRPENKDCGYQSSESLQATEAKCLMKGSTSLFSGVNIDPFKTGGDEPRVYLNSEDIPEEDCDHKSFDDVEAENIKPRPPNPLLTSGVHRSLLCCTNGSFQGSSRVFSEFESNCGCTTRNLVDWSTRVSWTSLNLRHQYKVREVTYLSPYRSSGFKWVAPYLLHYGTVYGFKQLASPLLEKGTAAMEISYRPQVTEAASMAIVKEESSSEFISSTAAENLGERPFVCEQSGCGRAFCRNEELTRHSRIHSGHRPFLCQKCGRRFVRRDHLTKHQRTHLPVHAKCTYACPLPACLHRYTRSDALTRHMWTAHHIRARQPTRPLAAVLSAGSAHLSPGFTSLSLGSAPLSPEAAPPSPGSAPMSPGSAPLSPGSADITPSTYHSPWNAILSPTCAPLSRTFAVPPSTSTSTSTSPTPEIPLSLRSSITLLSAPIKILNPCIT